MNRFYILITIDTENPQTPLMKSLWNRDIILEKYGIPKIVDVCNKYNVKATFYLDIYDKYCTQIIREGGGEKLMLDVCDYICNSQNDIQLHTHPVWCRDSAKKCKINMYQYNYEEQLDIINQGIDDIKKITGIKPIAHRAGGYSINNDTLKAVIKSGIKIDSSMFYGNKNCKVNTWSYNKIIRKKDLIEFPISVFKKLNYCHLPEIKKVDIDGCSFDEIIWFYKRIRKKNLNYMNIFMHSYSFYKLFKCYGNKVLFNRGLLVDPDLLTINKLCRCIEFLKKEPNVQFVTVSQFYKIIKSQLYSLNCDNIKDYLPSLIL